MAEKGESSSGSRPSCPEELWAKLVPIGSSLPDVEIRSNETNVNSEISSSSPDKHEWCKITRNSDNGTVMIQNKSSTSILVDGEVVEREEITSINCGSEIISGTTREGHLSYRFETMSALEHRENHLKVSMDVEHTKCSICLSIWHDVVTVAPCLHNFCNGCFSQWLRRSQEKKSGVPCPQCRASVQFVGKNHFLRNLVEDIVQADSSLKRPSEEVARLDAYASIGSNLIIRGGKRRKRTSSMLEEASETSEPPCRQCGTEYRGFRCNQNTVHMQCQTCGGMMPCRNNDSVPQYCLGCDRAFCGAYWSYQGVTRSDGYPICDSDSFKPIKERSVTRMPYVAHEKNRHEQDITERCIIQMGRTLPDVIAEWVVRFNNREIDRTRMPLNHAENLTAETYICNDCYDRFVSYILYWFRASMPRHLLPPDAADRENCWYGYACRTQHHNEQHAKKRNHVCRPTRGSHFGAAP